MTPEELEVLQARIAALEAQLNPAPLPPPPPFGVVEPEVRVTQHIMTLVGAPESGCLSRDVRVVRQLVAALALSYGVATPGTHIPKLWVGPLRHLAAARAAGRSWRDALAEAGLEVPGDLQARARDLRRGLDDLQDGLFETVALTLATASSVSQARLRQKLSKLFS